MIVKKLTTLLDFDLDRASLAAAKAIGKDLKAGLIAASASAIAVGGALLAMVKKTADAGDLAAKTGRRLGLTTEAVQEYGYIAELSGVKTTEFAMAIARLAKKGGFDDTDQALGALADKFAAMPDGMEKTALAQEYFGRSGAQLITLLNAGSAGLAEMKAEAHALGFVISDEAARGMEQFNDDISRLKRAGQGLIYTLGGALIPELDRLAQQLVVWAKQNRDLLRQRVTEWARRLVVGLRDLVKWARDIHARIQPLVERLGGWEGVLKKLIVAVVAFKATEFAANILQITIALGKAAKAMKLFNVQTLINPYVLVAIALLGIALALEDIQGYTEGKDSLMGSLLDGWEEDADKMNYIRSFFAELLADLGLLSEKHKISYGFDDPSEFRKNYDRYLKTALPFDAAWKAALLTWGTPVETAITGAITSAWTAVTTFISSSVVQIRNLAVEIGSSISSAITTAWMAVVAFVERSLQLIRDKALEIGRSVSGAVTGGARSILPQWIADRVLPNTATPGASSQTLTLTAGPVTVNANTGASPAEIGRAVQQAQQDGLAPLLRQAWRTLAPAED